MCIRDSPDFVKTFYLQTDASNVALGAELYQEDSDKEHHTIAFASRSLLAAEINYTTTEKELLSIVFAVGKFRTYILGNKTVIRTDHKALSFLNSCRLTHSRLTRWVLTLQAVSYTHLDVYKRQIQKRGGDGDIETKVNICRESEIVENDEGEMHVSDERVWENSCLLYTSRCV